MTLNDAIEKALSYTSDSRLLREGDIFIALKGLQADGHDYVGEILKKNPVAVVVDKSFAGNDPRLVRVEDTTEAHRVLAAAFRQKFRGKLVAVGGSNGKTSTKEFLATLLSEKFKIIKTDKSQNGELGIPKTLEKLRPDIEVAVVEVGIDGPGDMRRHADLLQPDIALLTSIGEEHLNLLKSVDNVFQEEKILFDVTWGRGGFCFAPEVDSYLQKLSGKKSFRMSPARPLLLNENFLMDSALPPLAEQNAALAVLAALELGLSVAEVAQGLKKLEVPEGRGRVYRMKNGGVLVADHYNANPSSMKQGLAFARSRARGVNLPLVLIIGDMLDLGEQSDAAHASLVPDFEKSSATHAIFVGPQWKTLQSKIQRAIPEALFFENSSEAIGASMAVMNPAACVYLKGSNGMRLDRIFSALKGFLA